MTYQAERLAAPVPSRAISVVRAAMTRGEIFFTVSNS
jgi:hypothetical protein